jgi:hypothetical protein
MRLFWPIGVLAIVISGMLAVTSAGARPAALRAGAPIIPQSRAHCPAIAGGTGVLPDGDFSQLLDPGNIGTTYYKPARFAPHWKVAKGNVDFNGSTAWGIGWYCSVDLDGYFTVGGVRTAMFPTVQGLPYTVTFYLSGNGGDPPTVKSMELEAAGQSTTFTWDSSNNNDIEHGDYAVEQWTFGAQGPSAALKFVSTDPKGSSRGPVIAGVSVFQISAPERQ